MIISFKPWSYVAVPIFFLIVKLHLQGYSVQSLAYLNRCSIPYNVDEEDYQVKFEKWRVCRLESVILVFIVDRGMIQLAFWGGEELAYETDGDAGHLAKGCKFWILVSLRVFRAHHHYIKPSRNTELGEEKQKFSF